MGVEAAWLAAAVVVLMPLRVLTIMFVLVLSNPHNSHPDSSWTRRRPRHSEPQSAARRVLRPRSRLAGSRSPPPLMARPPLPTTISDGAAIEPRQVRNRRCPRPPSVRKQPMNPTSTARLMQRCHICQKVLLAPGNGLLCFKQMDRPQRRRPGSSRRQQLRRPGRGHRGGDLRDDGAYFFLCLSPLPRRTPPQLTSPRICTSSSASRRRRPQTATQVASYAQKHFLHQTNPGKKKRRASIFNVVAVAGHDDGLLSPQSYTAAKPAPAEEILHTDRGDVPIPSYHGGVRASEAITCRSRGDRRTRGALGENSRRR